MNENFDLLLKKLNTYEQELKQLNREYNPNNSSLKMELLVMKMNIISYKYLTECFEFLNIIYKDKYLDLLKKSLIITSYSLTGFSIIKSPIITLPSLIGSLYLSIKNKHDKIFDYKITDEQKNHLLDLLDNFENESYKAIDKIYNQIDLYEDEKIINSLSESDKRIRITCQKLMCFLREDSSELTFENNQFLDDLVTIINDTLNTNCNNPYELLQIISDNYEYLNQTLIELDKKNNKLNRLYKLLI